MLSLALGHEGVHVKLVVTITPRCSDTGPGIGFSNTCPLPLLFFIIAVMASKQTPKPAA